MHPIVAPELRSDTSFCDIKTAGQGVRKASGDAAALPGASHVRFIVKHVDSDSACRTG